MGVDQSGFCSENVGFHFHHPSGFQATSASSSSSSSAAVAFSSMAALNSELELHRQEIDFLLHSQYEKLRNSIEDQRKEEVKVMTRDIEREGWRIMRGKEALLAEAVRKGRDLEERVKKAEIEKEEWKSIVNAKEAMVMELNRKLEEALRDQRRQIIIEDAESHYNYYPLDQEEEESGGSGSRRRSIFATACCKSCKSRRNPCVVLFLPCRHLCSCKYCEAFLGCCPVCHSVKEATLEVLFL